MLVNVLINAIFVANVGTIGKPSPVIITHHLPPYSCPEDLFVRASNEDAEKDGHDGTSLPHLYFCQGIVGCTPTNVPLWEIPKKTSYIVGMAMGYNPQESLKTLNCPFIFVFLAKLRSLAKGSTFSR